METGEIGIAILPHLGDSVTYAAKDRDSAIGQKLFASSQIQGRETQVAGLRAGSNRVIG